MTARVARGFWLGAGLLAALHVAAGNTRTVEVEVPLPPQLKLEHGARLGFFALHENGQLQWSHAGAELVNAVRRDLLRAGNLRLADGVPAALEGRSPEALATDGAFVKQTAARLEADYLLAGELSLETREMTVFFKPETGSSAAAAPHQEITLVFNFYLYDGHTGALIHQERFTARDRFTADEAKDPAGILRLYELFRRDLLKLIASSRRREIRYLFKS
jgi:hypothetical protein